MMKNGRKQFGTVQPKYESVEQHRSDVGLQNHRVDRRNPFDRHEQLEVVLEKTTECKQQTQTMKDRKPKSYRNPGKTRHRDFVVPSLYAARVS